MTQILPLGGLLLLALPAAAQTLVPLTPFSRTDFTYVPDPTNDKIFRLVDLDLDGDYDSPGENQVFYDDTIGAFALTNCNGIAVGVFGQVFVSDLSESNIFSLVDLDGDGACHGTGEAVVWYDGNGGSATGIVLVSPANMSVDASGTVWVASAGNGGNPIDSIVRLQDLNFDGDANDVGESVEYYLPAPGGAGGDSIPQAVIVGNDGRLYLLDVPSSGSNAKGVYRLSDDDFSGTIDQPSEVQPYFIPAALALTPFFWGITLDAQGYFYMADTMNELVWRFRDDNNDGTVDPVTEAVIWWQSPTASLIWCLAAASDGSVLAAESQAPDRILRLADLNNDGVVDPVTETFTLWSDALGAPDIGNPRSIALGRPVTIQTNPAPSIGTNLSIAVFGTVGDLVQLYYSGATIAPLALPPYGFLELNPLTAFGLLAAGSIAPFNPLVTNVPIAPNPNLIGLSVHLQAFGGQPTLLRLGAKQTITFQP